MLASLFKYILKQSVNRYVYILHTQRLRPTSFEREKEREKGLWEEIGWYLDDGSDKLHEEVVLQQVGPVGVNEVDDKALDVRAVLVLIGHDHHFSVASKWKAIIGPIVVLEYILENIT